MYLMVTPLIFYTHIIFEIVLRTTIQSIVYKYYGAQDIKLHLFHVSIYVSTIALEPTIKGVRW